MPLTIDIFLSDPRKCGIQFSDQAQALQSYNIIKPRLLITTLETNPLYVQSLVQAMVDKENPGIRYPFDTWYNFQKDIDGDHEYFIKIPKKYVRGIYLAPHRRAAQNDGRFVYNL